MKAAYGLTFDPLEICPTQKSIASQFRKLRADLDETIEKIGWGKDCSHVLGISIALSSLGET